MPNAFFPALPGRPLARRLPVPCRCCKSFVRLASLHHGNFATGLASCSWHGPSGGDPPNRWPVGTRNSTIVHSVAQLRRQPCCVCGNNPLLPRQEASVCEALLPSSWSADCPDFAPLAAAAATWSTCSAASACKLCQAQGFWYEVMHSLWPGGHNLPIPTCH